MDDVRVEGQAVDDGGGQAGVGEGGAPLAERGVGGARDGGSFLAGGDDLEEELGAAGVESDIADLVEAEEVEAGVASDDAGELFVVGGLDELVDQGGGGDVPHPSSLFGGGGAQGDEEVGFAGAGVAEQDQWLSVVDPCPAGEVGQGCWGQVGQRGGVEGFEAFGARELGLVDPPDPAAGVAVVALGGQDLSEEGLVGQAFPGGGLGDRGGLLPHGGQRQDPAGGVDRRLGGGFR